MAYFEGIGRGDRHGLLPYQTASPISQWNRWDYLTADSEGRRLYVSRDREVVVLDLERGVILGKIPGKSVHGIAIATEFGRGFISCSDPGSVVIFDLKTLAVIDRVPVGADPNVILFDRKTRRILPLTAAANVLRRLIRRRVDCRHD
jgi:hypothetical protein